MTGLRALMVDVDGVVIVPPPGGWAANLERDLGLASATLQAHFFKPHWNDIVLGRAELHHRLDPVLAQHAPHLTSQQLAAYWFEHDAQFDPALLADLAVLRATGVQLHLATIQEHLRAAYLWDRLRFRDRFDAMHYAADLGCKKSDAAFYAAVEARTGFAPAEHLLLDDSLANVEAARAAGWRGAVWDGTRSLGQALAGAE
ncbi:HAD-IA family hydrolase [Phenylobacterium sp.]|uniref:HAD-IA family hydrolase n=1 Tax=Phenylobacterium sp. TaxID=1871053 RepID=UPI0025DDFD77|nr:HAD-IA family hydrolase [Phenylobacterium sp.]